MDFMKAIRFSLFAGIVAALLFPSLPSNAQNQYNNWYFGLNAGITFNGGAPTALTDGALSTLEGCATVSDPVTGNLLFYTDGVTVWNRQHTSMPNGLGLKGHWTSAQSALIVPLPGSDQIFYVFTAGAGFYYTQGDPNNGVRYSTVDMTADSGLGDVVEKSVELIPRGDATEMLNATRHCNGIDYWIIAHELETDRFRAYLLTDQGIVDTVISAIGTVRSGNAGTQSMAKFSSNGRLLAVATPGDKSLELFDFNNETGSVTNYRAIATDYNYYAPEFSPDNTKLYTGTLANESDPNYVYQFDLTAGSPNQIRQSRARLHTENGLWDGAQLQIAPDGRIYVSFIDRNFLGVINSPNLKGAAAGYSHNGIDLSGRITQYGLPNCISSDIFPSTPESADVSVHVSSQPGTARNGETTEVSIIVCNNGTEDILGLSVAADIPQGISLSGGGPFPIPNVDLQAGQCDTFRFSATMTGSVSRDTVVQICSRASRIPASSCDQAIDEEDCFDLTLLSPVDTTSGDYTFYFPMGCPGTNDVAGVFFNSRRYTDTITSIEFLGSGSSYFEYAGPIPVRFAIRPTSDQQIPVRVKRHHSGTLTAIMLLRTALNDTFRVKLIAEVKDGFAPVFDISELRIGNRPLPFDTCLTIRNEWDRAMRVNDTTWYHSSTGASQLQTPELPFVVAPGETVQICLRVQSKGATLRDTLQLGGGENVSVCPHCAFHTFLISDEAPRPISGVSAGDWVLDAGFHVQIHGNGSEGSLTAALTCSRPSYIQLTLFDSQGRRCPVGESVYYVDQRQTVDLDTRGLASGSYWLRVSDSDNVYYLPVHLLR